MRPAPLAAIFFTTAIGLSAPARAQSDLANAACLNDSCQMCAMGGTCFTNMLAQCRHPACFVAGIAGGAVGAVAGGIVGPLVLTLPGLALYPGADPAVAAIGAIVMGAGCGCAGIGVPAMLCGEVFGRSLSGGAMTWPWEVSPP